MQPGGLQWPTLIREVIIAISIFALAGGSAIRYHSRYLRHSKFVGLREGKRAKNARR
jgi:hypothetical protein